MADQRYARRLLVIHQLQDLALLRPSMSRAAPCTSLEVFRHVTSAELTNIVGYPTIGIIFDTALFGTALAQMLYYMSNYPKDPLWLKGLVAAIWSADVLKEITCVMMLWSLLVRHHADPVALASVPTPYIIEQIVDLCSAMLLYLYQLESGYSQVVESLAFHHRHTHVHYLCCLRERCDVLPRHRRHFSISKPWESDYCDQRYLAHNGSLHHHFALHYLSECEDAYPAVNHSEHIGPPESILSKLTRYTANRGIILCLHQALLLGTYIWDYKTGTQATEMFSFSRGALYFNAFLAVLNARHYLNASTSDTARYSSHNI